MKIILSVLLITVTSAIPIDNEKYDFHHVQHQSTVETARQRMSQRLSELEGRVGAQRIPSGYTYCGTCVNGYTNAASQSSRSSSQLSSMQSSGNSANLVEGSDYVGVGYVSHASDLQDDVQSRVLPSTAYGNSQSRFSASSNNYEEEEEDLQQRLVVPDVNNIHSSAYRASASNNEDVQSNIGYHDLAVSNDGKIESYSQRRQQQEESESSRTITKPQIYYVPAPVTSTSSQRASEALNQQRISLAVRPGTTTVLRVPVNVIHTPSVPSSQQYAARSNTGSSYQASGVESRPTVYYTPTTYDRYASSGNQYDSSRTTVQQPERYRTSDLSNYNSFNSQSRSQNEDVQEAESYQTRVSPSTITDGGSSRYAMTSGSSLNAQREQSRVQPFPVQSIESASLTAQRTAEEQQQRRYTPARPTYVQRQRNEESRAESLRSESSKIENANIYAPVVSTPVVSSQSRYSQNQQQQQQSQYSSRAGNVYSPYSPVTGTSSRIGSGITYTNSDNLYDYMSESERLARLQQQQLASSRQSSSSHSSVAEANRRTLDTASRLDAAAANFVGSSNLASRNSELDAESIGTADGGAGGYQRTRSWQKQSKWESGSQYGTDGKPTSFAMLSTAEAEKHNINGAEAGYKAATTTLENDGKVSTYSIHTP